jgi:hypothetical protein
VGGHHVSVSLPGQAPHEGEAVVLVVVDDEQGALGRLQGGGSRDTNASIFARNRAKSMGLVS